ncbi:MAG: DUF4183 domain-containing protein [Tissierellaceae bacterium]
MAVKLFKLVIDADTSTTTTVNPEIYRYFYEFDDGDVIEDVLTIEAAAFVDDEGSASTAIETVTAVDGYYLLFVNGVLQQSDLYTVEGDGSEVTVNDVESILPGTPIILVVTRFDPDSDSDTLVET